MQNDEARNIKLNWSKNMNKTLRGVTGPPQTSNMESFAIIVNGF